MALTGNYIRKAMQEGTWQAFRDGNPIMADKLTINPNSVNLSLHPKILHVVPCPTPGNIVNKFLPPGATYGIDGSNAPFIDLHDPLTFKVQEIDCTNGFILQPGNLYLGAVRESFDCSEPLEIAEAWYDNDAHKRGEYVLNSRNILTNFYPVVDGRSTTGRCGLSVHVTAGRGDYGFKGAFTLELTASLPVRVRAGDELAQIYFESLQGLPEINYDSVYSDQQDGPRVASLGINRFQPHPKENVTHCLSHQSLNKYMVGVKLPQEQQDHIKNCQSCKSLIEEMVLREVESNES